MVRSQILLFILLISLRAWSVIGGVQVPSGAFPSAVFIKEDHCSAVVIRQDLLLTAGHCIQASPFPGGSFVQKGFQFKILTSDPEAPIYQVEVLDAQVHSSWTQALKQTGDFNRAILASDQILDLGVIQLKQNLPLTAAKLPSRTRSFADLSSLKLLLTGFGCESSKGDPIEVLKYYSLPVMTATDGQWKFRHGIDSPRVCGGDSGSGIYENPNRELIGLVSGVSGSIGVAARLDSSEALRWVRRFLQLPQALEIAAPTREEALPLFNDTLSSPKTDQVLKQL